MLLSLLLLASASARAAVIPDCAHLPGDPAHDQPTLDDVMSCQKATREAWNGLDPKPSDADWDRLDDKQRAEARAYLQRNPDSAQPPKTADDPSKDAGQRTPALGGATDADLSRLDPQTAQALKALQATLQTQAGDGSKGVDPQMAKAVEDFLGKQQGGMSPEMKALVEAAAKDGPNLSADTMRKLQQAAQAGKAQGLDLDIDPGVEKSLLHDDFSKDPPAQTGGSLPNF